MVRSSKRTPGDGVAKNCNHIFCKLGVPSSHFAARQYLKEPVAVFDFLDAARLLLICDSYKNSLMDGILEFGGGKGVEQWLKLRPHPPHRF